VYASCNPVTLKCETCDFNAATCNTEQDVCDVKCKGNTTAVDFTQASHSY
jgi:hypothetical protein